MAVGILKELHVKVASITVAVVKPGIPPLEIRPLPAVMPVVAPTIVVSGSPLLVTMGKDRLTKA